MGWCSHQHQTGESLLGVRVDELSYYLPLNFLDRAVQPISAADIISLIFLLYLFIIIYLFCLGQKFWEQVGKSLLTAAVVREAAADI